MLLIIMIKRNKKAKLTIVRSSISKNKKRNLSNTLVKKHMNHLNKMAVDQDHYLFLKGLVEGQISEEQYDKWAHSRKHEGPEVYRQLLKRPYKTRKL